jgi:hypothetical protein
VGGVRGRGNESAGKGNQDCLLSEFYKGANEKDHDLQGSISPTIYAWLLRQYFCANKVQT